MSPQPGLGSPQRRNAVIGGLVLVVVVVLVVVWLANRSDDSSSPSSSGSSASPSPDSSTNPGATLSPSPSATTGGSSGVSPSPSVDPSDAMNPAKPQQVRFPQTAQPAKDVSLAITKVEAITGKGRIPGEISGPALRVSLTATNDTARRIAVNTTVANLYYGADSRPASPLVQSGAKPFPAAIKPGQQATGVFVFTVPKSDRAKLRIEVVLGQRFRVVNFNGSCPSDC